MPLRTIPVSYFRVVSGLAGLGNAWQAAHRVWALPAIWGESLMLAAAIVWAALVMGYGFKQVSARNEALAEAEHPVQCCFIDLIGASTSLVAQAC